MSAPKGNKFAVGTNRKGRNNPNSLGWRFKMNTLMDISTTQAVALLKKKKFESAEEASEVRQLRLALIKKGVPQQVEVDMSGVKDISDKIEALLQ